MTSQDADLGVSVAIAAFNPAEQHAEQLFATLSRQTTPVDEIVVTDDSSTEVMEKIASAWSASLPIAYERNETRLGMVANWNRAVSKASQPLVVLTGQDDGFEPTFVEVMRCQFTQEPVNSELLAVGCGRRLVDAEGCDITTRLRVNDRSRIYAPGEVRDLSSRELTLLCLRNGNALGEPCCVMFRKEAWSAVAGYDESLKQDVDVDFNLRIAQRGSVRYVAQPLVLRRRHQNNQTTANRQSGIVAAERHEMWRKYSPEFTRGSPERRAIDAAQVSFIVFDALSAVRSRNRAEIAMAPGRVREVGFPGIGPLASRACEVVSGRSRDRKVHP